MYLARAIICFLSIILTILLVAGLTAKPAFWRNHLGKIKIFYAMWFVPYFIFIVFFTGPQDIEKYPAQETSPYKLPWAAGVARLVAQGNRSFFSHREAHTYAWDFIMPIGTPVLAARDGIVSHVEMEHDGIGLSGLVGQTWFPHLHFYTTIENNQIPKAISFREVPGGVPFAGHSYTSENAARTPEDTAR